MSNHEKSGFNPETKHDQEALHELGAQHQERLRDNLHERAAEQSPEKAEDVSREARERALSREKQAKPEITPEKAPAERKLSGPRGKLEEASFNATMKEVRSQMSTPSRAFSKVIHNKGVEKVSEVTGNTIARPDAILSGAVFAFILTLGVYLLAKNLGYPLSGFEAIAAFALGWVLGLVYDFLKVMITGRK